MGNQLTSNIQYNYRNIEAIMNKKNCAIIFCLTSNQIFAVGNMLFDIARYCFDWVDEVRIFYDGKLRSRDVKAMSAIFPVKFIEYNFPIADTSRFNALTFSAFTKMVYAKFEALKLLDEFHNVICLDYDMVIRKDFRELIDFGQGYFKITLRGGDVGGQFHKPVPGYDMGAKGMCACTFSISDRLENYQQIYDFCYRKTEELAEYLMHPEQGIFDLAFQEFKITPEIIPAAYIANPNEPGYEDLNFALLHAAGSSKFWNGTFNQQWEDNYKEWIAQGGSHAKNRRPLRVFKDKIKAMFFRG